MVEGGRGRAFAVFDIRQLEFEFLVVLKDQVRPVARFI